MKTFDNSTFLHKIDNNIEEVSMEENQGNKEQKIYNTTEIENEKDSLEPEDECKIHIAENEINECNNEDLECNDEDSDSNDEDLDCNDEDSDSNDEDLECNDEDSDSNDEDLDCNDEDSKETPSPNDPPIIDLRGIPKEKLHFQWNEIFKNDHPIQFEIGPGKGEFLIGLAQKHPEKNFVGIEIRRKRAILIQNKALRAGLQNLQMILGDAKYTSEYIFPKESVEVMYVHFPDPWPKRRHACRRLVNAKFADIVHQLLVPSGKIYLSTDVETYSKTMFECFQNHLGFKNIYFETNSCPCPEFHNTVHEWKFQLWGRSIHYLQFVKI
jgi:tRNA (guanine-N7-)-methyltransferase